MTEPRRVLIEFDYRAEGIWLCTTKEELEASPSRGGYWVGAQPPGRDARPRPWSDLLSEGLLDALKAWNDAWGYTISGQDEEVVPDEVLEETWEQDLMGYAPRGSRNRLRKSAGYPKP